MSRYGSIAVTVPASVITRIVESSDPADLQARVNAAIAALPGGSVVTALTLAGAGDGALFTVTIEAGAAADVTGGFASPPSVVCFLGSNAESMLIAHGIVGNGAFADVQVAGASKGTRFMGMLVTGTVVEGGGGTISPFSALAYVDPGTTTPGPDQTGSVAAPFSTVQAALDAGFSHVYLTATSLEDVVAPGFVFLTGTDRVVGIRSLTLPDDSGAILDNVSVAPGSLVAGDRCQVITNASVRTAVFGDNGFLVLNGPGALSFVFLTSQLTLGALTMGASGTVLATNTLCTSGTTISANAVEMFGCTCRSSVTANSFEAQSSHLTIGTYTTTGPVNLQNVKCSAGVAFDNALGQAFNLDGFSNYWIKTNGVTLTNAGEKVITDDLTP